MLAMIAGSRQYGELDDEGLLAQCEVHTYKSSGPGGQHRNKVSSAVRLKHRPTGIMAHGDDSRSQHENKRVALRRLRRALACQLRQPIDLRDFEIPPVVAECLFKPRGPSPAVELRLEIGRKDFRFWQIAAFLLDLLEAKAGRLAEAAECLGISTSNLASILTSDGQLMGAAQAIRKAHGQKPLK